MKWSYERGGERWEIERAGVVVVHRSLLEGELVSEETIAATTELGAKWNVDRISSVKIADGFALISGSRSSPELTDSELEAAVIEDPDEIALYAVYGDWLQERGDVWGELMNLQCEIATLPRFGSTERREVLARHQTLLLFQHSERFWGPLGTWVVDAAGQRYASDCVTADWFGGFLRGAEVSDVFEFAEAWFETFGGLAIARLIREFCYRETNLSLPAVELLAAREWPLLSSFELSNESFLGRGDFFPAAPIAPLLEDGRATNLTELCINGPSDADDLCEVIATSDQAPRLRSLAIRAGQFTSRGTDALCAGRLSSLEKLTLTGTGFSSAAREQLRSLFPRVHVDELRRR